MDVNSQHRAQIHPVLDDSARPVWSVMIPTYNCAQYLRETLMSVLAQDPGPELMQIEVVDDCSTSDDPAAVVEELAAGRVTFYRQPRNLGHTGNFNTCIQRSRGTLVHILHGDDCVRPGFYSRMQRLFEAHPDAGAGFCRFIVIDDHGRHKSIWPLEQLHSGLIENWLEKIAVGQRIQTPAMVVRRSVYEQLGGFDDRIAYYGEDWEMWVRIAASFPFVYEVEPLAMYRKHSSSLSGHSKRTGANMVDLRMAIQIIKSYLPAEHTEEWSRKALENAADASLRRARRMLYNGKTNAALAQAREALKCSRSKSVVARAALFHLRWSRFKVRNILFPPKSIEPERPQRTQPNSKA